jgi:DNA modification methylase
MRRTARTHSAAQIKQIAASIVEFGFTNPVLIDDAGGIIAGHGRVLAAGRLGIAEVPCIRLAHLTDAQRRAYIIADNKLAENAGWDEELLAKELLVLTDSDFDALLTGFQQSEIDKLLKSIAPPQEPPEAGAPPEIATTQPGEVWALGRHLIYCGDSQDAEARRIMAGGDCVLTDPPYCSGGFQESGKAAGSVGTSAEHVKIINDRLSTRGFQALIKSAVFGINATAYYVFTDWRMWCYLFDLAEAAGAGVRSMIVWDKGTAGMGRGWRAQHELILFAYRQVIPYPKSFSNSGNVITCKRTGNINHTTEKPVDLLSAIMENTPFAKTFCDPFLGSGSTLIAAERCGVRCVGAEISPGYCDVTIARWEAFTGKKAERVTHG